MRLRILRQPTGIIDGFPLDHFRPGDVYELSAQLASVFLSEGWAEPADGQAHSTVPAERISALVLVVDDDRDVRTLAASVLSWNGYRVIQARHGREAMDHLVQYAPDLVVLDLNMPVMDGWEFRAEQQRLPDWQLAAVPVVLLTGTDGAASHAATLKAVGLVEKPFDPDKFLGAIRTALQH